MFVRGMTIAIVIATASVGAFWTIPPAPAADAVIDLPVGAYTTQAYFVSALGACRQGEKIWYGDQPLELCFGSAQEPPFPRKNPQFVFYVIHNEPSSHEYQWQAWHGNFQLINGEIQLCGREGMIGVIPSEHSTQASRPTIRFFGDMFGANRMDKYEMVRDEKLSKDKPPSLPEKGLLRCGGGAVRPGTGGRRLPWSALSASVAPATGEPGRGVNGVVMLGLHANAAARDTQLWNCLVNNGNYPGVHFVERSSGQDRWSYIWPDGRFRAVLDGGARYQWRLAPPIRCGVTRAQSFRADFRVPALDTPAQEELVLACLVAEEGFSDCRSWWLRRPR